MNTSAGAMILRTVCDSDLPLLAEWLRKDYILKWFQDADDWLYEIEERSSSFAWIHHFIVMMGETPIGFCQYYDCFDGNAFEDWYDVTVGGDTFSIDYLIGNEAFLGKGYGKAIVKLLTDRILADENAKRIIVQPKHENLASNGVLLANGYVYDKSLGYYVRS